jgi:hypothetical protein
MPIGPVRVGAAGEQYFDSICVSIHSGNLERRGLLIANRVGISTGVKQAADLVAFTKRRCAPDGRPAGPSEYYSPHIVMRPGHALLS